MAAQPTALIIGAGIAGLSAAWWLDKAGWKSIIVERSPSIRDGGYVMSLSGPSRNTIRQMGLEDTLYKIGARFDENIILDANSRELIRFKYVDAHGSGPDGSLAICRNDLARVLAKVLPGSAVVHYGKTLAEVSEQGSKIIATLKQSGDTIEADLLIGADGVRSDIRDRFWKGVDCLQPLGYSYAVYDIGNAPTNKLSSSCVTYNSPGHCDILYELRNNRRAGLHLWRDDYVNLDSHDDRMKTVRAVTTETGIKAILEAVDEAGEAGCTPVVDSMTMINLPQWSKGRVLLFGDSAHCLTLISGQGAGMALVSAEILSKELQATADVAQALANHEKNLRPSITRLQDRSRKLAAVFITKNWFSYTLRNLVIKILPYSWIVGWFAKSAKSELELLAD